MNFARFPFRSYGRRRGSTESWLKVGRLLRRNSDRISSRCSLYFCAAQDSTSLCFSCFILFVTDCDSEEIRRDFQYGNCVINLIWSYLMDEKRFVNHYAYRYAWYNKRSQSTIFTYNLLKLLDVERLFPFLSNGECTNCYDWRSQVKNTISHISWLS